MGDYKRLNCRMPVPWAEANAPVFSPFLEGMDSYTVCKKNLKQQYLEGGMPMWVMVRKQGIRVFLFLLMFFIILDLYTLWFYDIRQENLQLIMNKNPVIHSIIRGEMTPVQIRWLEPADANGQETFRKFSSTLGLWSKYMERCNREIHIFPLETNPNFTPLPMPEEDIKAIWNNWTGINSTDVLAFPRPVIKQEEIDKINQLLLHPAAYNPEASPAWESIAFSYLLENSQIQVEPVIQWAKELMVSSPYINHFSTLQRHFKWFIPKDKLPQFCEANAHWIAMYLDATKPNPEPMIDLLYMTGCSNTTYDMIKENLHQVSDVSQFQEALRQYIKIPFVPALQYFTEIPSFDGYTLQKTTKDAIAGSFSDRLIFQWQCSLMQKFCTEKSPSWLHYEVLKTGSSAVKPFVEFPNIINAEIRLKAAAARQAILATILTLYQQDTNFEQFSEIKTIDPFTKGNLRIAKEDKIMDIRSTGPDKMFDTEIYDPSNGLLSKGDIVWKIDL